MSVYIDSSSCTQHLKMIFNLEKKCTWLSCLLHETPGGVAHCLWHKYLTQEGWRLGNWTFWGQGSIVHTGVKYIWQRSLVRKTQTRCLFCQDCQKQPCIIELPCKVQDDVVDNFFNDNHVNHRGQQQDDRVSTYSTVSRASTKQVSNKNARRETEEES